MVLTVGQHQRNHLRDHRNLRKTFYPSPIPQNLCAFEERRFAVTYRNPRLYLELSRVLPCGYLLSGFPVHSP